MSKKNKKSKTQKIPSKTDNNIIITTETKHDKRKFDIIRIISQLIILIPAIVCAGALLFIIIKCLGDFTVLQLSEPGAKAAKTENIGNIISIKTETSSDDNYFDSSPASYTIEYTITKNNITTVKTETLTEKEIILDDTIEKPIAVRHYYKKLVFKAERIYLKISTEDFKTLRGQNITIY